jgi:CHC2 zinc finger
VIILSSADVAIYFALRVPDLGQRGKRWRGRCPIHRGKHDSFSVNPETGLWRCWSDCGCGGDIIALEIALTGAQWLDAVAEVEYIIGRSLINRPATRAERQAWTERREREQREMRAAEFFRTAATSLAEHVLDQLPEAVPERFGPTQLLLSLRGADGAPLRTPYRDYLAREPRLTAALVYAGERAWGRKCNTLARFIAALAGARDAD